MPQDVVFSVPFHAPISPHLDKARFGHLEWVAERGLVRSQAGFDEYVSWDLPQAVARTYPYTEADDLVMLMNWFALAFLFDDQFDSGSADRTDRIAEVAREMITIPFRAPGAATEIACPITSAWAEVWLWMCDGMSLNWQNRFASAWGRFLAGHAHEIRMSAAGVVPRLDEYLALRRLTVGIHHSIDAAERSRRFELPPHVAAHPHFALMRDAATDTIAQMNDIHSLEREERRGDPHNLVVVLRQHLNCSRDIAILEATRMTNERLGTFLALQEGLPLLYRELRLDDAEREAAEMSVEAMRNWIRGNYDWALSSGRYSPPEVGPDGRAHAYVDDLLTPAGGGGVALRPLG